MMAAAMTEDLVELAEICLSNAKIIKDYFSSNGLPHMSFKEDGPPKFPPTTAEIEHARDQLRTASKLIHDLASGPEEILCWTQYANVCFLFPPGPSPFEYPEITLTIPRSLTWWRFAMSTTTASPTPCR